jgi:hypothetical protein
MDNIENAPVGDEPQPNTTGNEITRAGKIIAGLLLIAVTAFSLIAVIGFWPDRLPSSTEKNPKYELNFFHVRLVEADSDINIIIKKDPIKKDSINKSKPDSISNKKDTLIAKTITPNSTINQNTEKEKSGTCNTVSINTLLLLLVAIAGFLGNMLHVTTSFTTFVGANKFKRSWMLWYCVKPFTAAGLAMILYFTFRAGFLNSSNDVSNLNLFGVMTLAALAGLFTDTATQKLKEVFDTVFKPGDSRPNKL